MKRIDIDEAVQPRAATVGQTFLRAVVGVVMAGHGVEKLMHLRSFEGELIQVGVPNPEIVAFVVLAIELLAGFGLLIGRWTRVSAFAGLCDALAVLVMLVMQHRGLEMLPAVESAALLGAASFYFLTAGSGTFSADTALRRRAQMKALRDDEIWQRPPYVGSETYAAADGVVYQDPDAFVDPAAEIANRRQDVRRRFFVRHSG